MRAKRRWFCTYLLRWLCVSHGLAGVLAPSILVAGDRSEAISDIELELVSGSVEGIFLLAHELIAHFPLRSSVRSKSARGLDLALGIRPGMLKLPEIKLAADATLEKMFDAFLRATIQHLLQKIRLLLKMVMIRMPFISTARCYVACAPRCG